MTVSHNSRTLVNTTSAESPSVIFTSSPLILIFLSFLILSNFSLTSPPKLNSALSKLISESNLIFSIAPLTSFNPLVNVELYLSNLLIKSELKLTVVSVKNGVSTIS